MIDRYARPKIRGIWSEQRKKEIWLEVEILAAEAIHKNGIVSDQELEQIKSKAAFSIERCNELEATLHHDVIAFTTNVSENVGEPANKWIHFGLTSSDILDTAFAVQLKESADILIDGVKSLRETIAAKAREHKLTPMIGRSHGIHAEPLTFGLKMALMYDEFGRAITRLENAKKQASVGKVSGAVGTHAHLAPDVEKYICESLGLEPTPIATQVIQRDIHAEYMNALALTAASVERWATEFRHLQRTEVLEAEEFFSKGQKGSSAMPHKRNPITGERLTGLARVIRGHAVAAMENIALWHERDISHSSVERIIFPDSCVLLDYMLYKLNQLVEGLIVYPENMQRNMKLTLGMWHSQTVMLALVKKGLTREEAYKLVQRNAMDTWKAKHEGNTAADFKSQLLKDPEIAKLLSANELDEMCHLDFHLRHVDQKFKSLGIE